MKKGTLHGAVILALVCVVVATSAVAGDKPAKPAPAQKQAPAPKLATVPVQTPRPGDNYTVNTGNTTFRSQGQAPAPQPAPAKPVATKTIMLPTWPVNVPARVPVNTPERPDNPHAGENAGAAEGLGTGR
jgi:hypothetical protein